MKRILVILLFLSGSLVTLSQPVPAINKRTLAVMREQQKLCRDVYCALYDKWNQKVFDQISGSETAHMEALQGLLEQYEVADPIAATGDAPGKFVYKRFQRLHDSLVTSGCSSLEEAYRVGAFVEELDIRALQKAIDATGSEDLKATYKYMMVASERHLLSFARGLKALGITYQPVLLSKRQYERLVGASGGRTGKTEGKTEDCNCK